MARRKVKLKANARAQPPAPQALIGVPLCYSELSDRLPSAAEADALVRALAKKPSFYLLAMLNTLLSFYEKDFKAYGEVQGFLFGNLLDDELFRQAQRKFPNERMGLRPMFHRQQMLVLMKKILSSAADEGGLDPNHTTEGRHALGRLALMTNDLLDVEEQGRRLTELGGREEDREAFYEEFCTQMLPTYELTNPPNVLMAFVRSAEYFSIFEREAEGGRFVFSDGDSLAERFFKLTGLGLRDYLLLIFTVYLNYKGQAEQDDALRRLINEPARFNVGVDIIFSKMRLTAKERRAFFGRTATDFDSLAGACRATRSRVPLLDQYDFTAFRSYPLVYTREERDIVTCVDSALLAEKVSTGVYYTIKKSLEDGAVASEAARRDHDSFLSHWGSVFEIYTNDRLRGVRSPGLKRFYDSPYYDDPPSRSDTQAFDAVLDYGGSLVVIEHKGKYLELGAKYSGRRELLLAELRGTKRIGKGVYQLADNIQLVFDSEPGARRHAFHERGEGGRPVKQFGLKEIGRVRRVYPVIVHQDFSLGFNGVNRIMSIFFRTEIARRRVDQEMVRPLSLLTVEDLEVIIPYLAAIPLPEILEEYATYDDPLTNFDKIFKGLCLRRRTAFRDSPWVERRKEELGKELMELFVDFSD